MMSSRLQQYFSNGSIDANQIYMFLVFEIVLSLVSLKSDQSKNEQKKQIMLIARAVQYTLRMS